MQQKSATITMIKEGVATHSGANVHINTDLSKYTTFGWDAVGVGW